MRPCLIIASASSGSWLLNEYFHIWARECSGPKIDANSFQPHCSREHCWGMTLLRQLPRTRAEFGANSYIHTNLTTGYFRYTLSLSTFGVRSRWSHCSAPLLIRVVLLQGTLISSRDALRAQQHLKTTQMVKKTATSACENGCAASFAVPLLSRVSVCLSTSESHELYRRNEAVCLSERLSFQLRCSQSRPRLSAHLISSALLATRRKHHASLQSTPSPHLHILLPSIPTP